MATVRLMTTVLPHSVDPGAEFHVSLFFTHRLVPDGPDATLANFPALANWPDALRNATIELRIDNQTTPIACTPITSVLSDAAWHAAFPATTRVTAFPQPSTTNVEWRTYPASAMPDHTIAAHYASVFSSPVTPPAVTGSRLARAVLDYFRSRAVEGIPGIIRGLDSYREQKDSYREQLEKQRRDNAKEARDVCSCEDGPGRLELTSPLQQLLDRGSEGTTPIAIFDNAVTRLLDGLVHPVSPSPGDGGPILHLTAVPAPPDAVEPMLRDTHATQLYYNRPEEHTQSDPPPQPIPGAHRDRPADRTPDFHALAAAAGNIPVLARQLGFVLDINVADLGALAAARTIRCDVTIPNVERLLSPETACAAEGSLFLADAGGSDQWQSGCLTIGRPEYRVLDLDPDASGLKLEQHLRGVVRAYATELNGDTGNYAPATVRATGFAIAHLEHATTVRNNVTAAESRKTDIVDAGAAASRQTFRYSDLVRGLRVEVWDDFTRQWHSLHNRTVSVDINGTPLLTDTPDTGLVQNASLSRAPGDPNNAYHLHEVVAGWDGWSLSAPRPGLTVVHDSGQGNRPGSEMITDSAEARPGTFAVRSTAAAASLPALRYGRRYAFRVLGVDLAGNSVDHDMGIALPGDVSEATTTSATAHLERLRGEVATRDAAGLLEQQRPAAAAGGAAPQPGLVGRVHDAVAAIEKTATNLITRPHLDVTPSQFGALYARSGTADTVTTPRLFLRWDPVSEPTVVARRRFTTGESSNRVVIRTTAGGTTTSERHLIPPKTSQLEAELDGCFDELMKSSDPAARRRAYAIALKERGSLFNTGIQDLDDPQRLIAQPGVTLETAASADPAAVVTLADLQDPEKQPAAGQYVVHDIDNLVIPYLPDPMVRGVALVFYEAGADHHLSDRRVLQSVVIPYTGQWPAIDALRLIVHGAAELGATQNGNEIHVGLPPGEQVGMAISSTLDPIHLERLGLWRFHAAHDPAVTDHDRQALERAALDGWLWWLTPSADLRLVNATPGPAKPPMITALTAPPRTTYSVTAELNGTLDIHGASTERVELRAEWTDIEDNPASAAPTPVTRKAIVAKLAVAQDERISVLAIDAPAPDSRPISVPVRPVIHTLPDTRYRNVDYRLHGTSRYREFFNLDELPAPDDLGSAGNLAQVTHLNSAPPPPPVVHDIIPMFLWEEHHEPHHPFATRRIRRSGVRIWLDRPWFTSGDDEMLAIITGTADSPPNNRDIISLWGRDPARVGPALSRATDLPLLPTWEQLALQLHLDPHQRPGRPHTRVTIEPHIDAYLYRPEFHPGRRRWFVDALFDAADAAWPFLRLNVARYQPNSTRPDCALSKDVNTDFIQLLPERITTISRPDADTVRVTTSGVFAYIPARDAAAANPDPDPARTLTAQVASNRQVHASLQTRAPGAKSDLDWTTTEQIDCDVESVDPPKFTATWSGALSLKPAIQLATPGEDRNLRVLVEEYESLPTDPEPGPNGKASISRLIYADYLYL